MRRYFCCFLKYANRIALMIAAGIAIATIRTGMVGNSDGGSGVGLAVGVGVSVGIGVGEGVGVGS